MWRLPVTCSHLQGIILPLFWDIICVFKVFLYSLTLLFKHFVDIVVSNLVCYVWGVLKGTDKLVDISRWIRKRKKNAVTDKNWPTYLIWAETILIFRKQRGTHLLPSMISGIQCMLSKYLPKLEIMIKNLKVNY